MHEGIGRAGYRLLAAVFLGLGLLGAALAWYGTTQPGAAITVLGLVLAGVALTLLFVQAVVLPATLPGERGPSAGPRRPPMAGEQPARIPQSDVGFEYDDSRPAARAAPEQLVVPPAFQSGSTAPPAPPAPPAPSLPSMEPLPVPANNPVVHFSERDAAAWPGSRGPSAWTTEQKARQQASQRAGYRRPRDEFTQKYTRRTPTVRQILTDAPAAGKAAAAPEGKSRGKCGQCGTILLAPNKRPLNLKCPVCQKVSRLE